MKDRIVDTIHTGADALLQMSDSLADQLLFASDMLVERLLQGAKIFTWGGGLNASLAQACSHLLHIGHLRARPPFPALCLNTDTSLLSGPDSSIVVENQLTALAQAGDVLITFCSGDNPEGLAAAIAFAHQCGLTVVAFCCPTDDHILNALSGNDCAVTPFTHSRVAVIHTLMLAAVTLCDTVEQQLFGADP